MSIWIILWGALSLTLLYFLFWTLFILYQQKRAWKTYAARRKLRYESDSPLSPPTLTGPFEDYTISLFTGEHTSTDMRGTRKLTAVEIKLESSMPVTGGVASGGMVSVLQNLALKDEFKPSHEKWDDSYIAACENRGVIDAYLTPARLDSLTRLMALKNAWVILVFKDDTLLLRFDTPDALAHDKKIDILLKKMVETAKILEFEPGEGARLKAEEVRKPKKQASIELKDKDIDSGGLQLEEEAEAPQEDEEKPSTENS